MPHSWFVGSVRVPLQLDQYKTTLNIFPPKTNHLIPAPSNTEAWATVREGGSRKAGIQCLTELQSQWSQIQTSANRFFLQTHICETRFIILLLNSPTEYRCRIPSNQEGSCEAPLFPTTPDSSSH